MNRDGPSLMYFTYPPHLTSSHISALGSLAERQDEEGYEAEGKFCEGGLSRDHRLLAWYTRRVG